jgi:hypothetical protein
MKTLLCCLVVPLAVWSAFSEPFQNLGFDDANTNRLVISPSGALAGTLQDALPGWQLAYGTVPVDEIYLNARTGLVSVALLDENAFGASARFPAEGRFALGFYHVGVGPTGPLPPLRLTQTGDIPADARTLHFVVISFPNLTLNINGNRLDLTYVERPPGKFVSVFDVYADVTPYAGKPAQIEFLNPGDDLFGLTSLDSISFIPEPGTRPLFVVGLAVLVWAIGKRGHIPMIDSAEKR